jgi:selenocysteine lyase/cysteine desulfurase
MSSQPLDTLDVGYIRGCFPTFEEPLAAKTAFFENAGGSYVAGAVLDKLVHFYRHNKVQPYGACEILSAAGEQMDAGRETMAKLLGVNPDTLTLGASTTQNINTLAHACSAIVGPGSEVIVTDQDHEANIGAWERLCARQGATLKFWQVDAESGELDIHDFAHLLTENTAIACVTHSSNIVGTVNPVEEIIRLCRDSDTHIAIDGVSFAPHRWPDIPTLKPDAYCFSTYKTYATHLGVMYCDETFTARLDPQCHHFNQDYLQKKLDSSGPDHASIAALAGLGDYFDASHQHHFGNSSDNLYQKAQQISTLMHQHESMLCDKLLQGIDELPLRVIGRTTSEGREANVALVSQQHSSAALSAALARNDIAAGSGDFYARRLIERIGLADPRDGVLRISFAHYNTIDDVNRVIDVLHQMHGPTG